MKEENRIYVDPLFNLPVGVGFDDIIDRKREVMNSQKLWNDQVMDELVTSLGYLDYRDFLACNKYILEAKDSTDCKQQARAYILNYAMQ